ncbi:MAG: hypothetical protein AAF705_20795, partial [Bacteroidota bacterium]
MASLLKTLCIGDKSKEKEEFCRQLFNGVVLHIEEYKPAKNNALVRSVSAASRKNTLAYMLASVSWLRNVGESASFFDHVLQKDKEWNLDKVVLPFLVELPEDELSRYDPLIFQHLVMRAVKTLETHLSKPLIEPTDWTQNVRLNCKTADCEELQAFAVHPEKTIHRFTVNKDRIQRLHQLIEQHDLDMNHVTERLGSPYTLVCT